MPSLANSPLLQHTEKLLEFISNTLSKLDFIVFSFDFNFRNYLPIPLFISLFRSEGSENCFKQILFGTK